MFGRPKSAALEFNIQNRSGAAVAYTIGERTFELPPRVTRTHTRRRPAEAKFTWPGDEKPGASVKPASGDKCVVNKVGDAFAVKKE